jgi:acyl-coenzyme A synthetase/AMP-(fatty) acid ligase
LDATQAPNFRWFVDGELNVSWNCLDVHLAERGHKTAILFEGEPGDQRRLTYRELHGEVCRFANAMKARGIGRGDRVVIYMPMVPEAVVAMQACARIGAIHSVVFGGFSAISLKERIEDAGARCLITADGGHRGGNVVELKAAADKALADGCDTIDTVFVLRRTGAPFRCAPIVTYGGTMRSHYKQTIATPNGSMPSTLCFALHLGFDRQAQRHSTRERRIFARSETYESLGVRFTRRRRSFGVRRTSVG